MVEKPQVQEGHHHGKGGGLLAAVSGGGGHRRECRQACPPGSSRATGTGAVDQPLHLGDHVAEAGGGAEDDAIRGLRGRPPYDRHILMLFPDRQGMLALLGMTSATTSSNSWTLLNQRMDPGAAATPSATWASFMT